jgi:hypothetical protein
MESARPSFLENEHRPGASPRDDGVAFWHLNQRQFFHEAAQSGHRQAAEIAELVKKTVQGSMPRGHLDIVF